MEENVPRQGFVFILFCTPPHQHTHSASTPWHCTYRASFMSMKTERSPRTHDHNGLMDDLMLGCLYLVILNQFMFQAVSHK